MRAEDFDAIDEHALQLHDGHPVEVAISVRLGGDEFRLLAELAESEGTDPAATIRAALRYYAAARSQRTYRDGDAT